MKKERSLKQKKTVPYLTLALIFAGVTVCFCLLRYELYREQMMMVVNGLEKGNVNNIFAMLKDKQDILTHYGYIGPMTNVYGRECLRDCLIIILLNQVIFFVILFVLMRIEKNNRQDIVLHCREISNQICAIGRNEELKTGIPVEEPYSSVYGELQHLYYVVQEMRNRAEEEEKKTKALVTDISHQLKTPVTALKSGIEILKENDLTEQEQREFVLRTHHQVTGLEKMVDSLVNISRMENNMIVIKKETALIFETVLEAVTRVFPKADKKNIEISMVETEGMEKLRIPHDRKWICESIINVLDNAIKYSPENTEIKIRMEKRNAFLRIEIKDQGIGISQKDYHKVFRRFYRSEEEVVQNTEGSGIGLYLARNIIEQHHGMIFIGRDKENRKKGTMFVIQLPYI